MMVQPPKTASGSEANSALTAGTKPASSITAAPHAIALRFTTFVMAMRPIFCANDVSGVQPNTPESALTKPSAAIAPWNSRSVG